MSSWYPTIVRRLFQDSLGFQIAAPCVLVLFVAIYIFQLTKESMLTPQLKPYTSLVYLITSLIIVLTFVAIGPWVIETRFWIIFVFQILQLFVYSILAFFLVSNFGTIRMCCYPVHLKSGNKAHAVLLRIYVFACHIILGLWVHYTFDIACGLIDQSLLEKNWDDKDFRNCILLIAGGNLTLSAMHVGAGLAELFVAAISACVGGKNGKRKFVSI